jgi:hypothetical protein
MPIRYAASAGLAIIAATIGAFLFIPQHQIAGSNNFARFGPFINLRAKGPWCQHLPSVPGGAGYVRLGISRGPTPLAMEKISQRSELGPVKGVRVTVQPAGFPIDNGSARNFNSGRKDIPLERPTEPASKGKICVYNLGYRVLALYGEPKRRSNGVYHPKLAVTFLEADATTFASRTRLMARRYGYSHAGVLGSWAVVLAALLALAMAALALRLVTRRPAQ